MLAGIQHLSDMGIDNLTNSTGAPAQIQQLIQENPRLADIAEFVREEVLSFLLLPASEFCINKYFFPY